MRRREFIATIGGAALASPFVASAEQQSGQMRKIGLLMATRENDPMGGQQMMNFRSALEALGWTDGRNIVLEFRWSAGEPSRARQYARELVGLAPDLIVASSTIGLEAARSETSNIPILFVAVSDPVEGGYVESLARPGGKVTGFSSFGVETSGKWLEIIKEAVPAVTRVGVLIDPDYAGYMARWHAVQNLGPSFGVELSIVAIRSGAEIERAIATFAGKTNSALIVFSSALTTANSNLIIDSAARYRLPAIYPFKFYAQKGGLMSYGIDTPDMFRRSASYADRILRGASPSDLPVQAPTKYEFVINVKTANALGITMPPTLMTRADEVIE